MNPVDSGNFSAGVLALMLIGVLIVLVLWILLPFAVFGMKPLLRQLLSEQRSTNELLRRAAAERELAERRAERAAREAAALTPIGATSAADAELKRKLDAL